MASILVVDDDAHIREVARFALARAGHAVELATDGAAAYDRVMRGGIELIVLDILMPELDGLALCRRLRAHGTDSARPIPIVFLSSRGEEADRVLGLDLGADDYVTKPFSPRELVAGTPLDVTATELRLLSTLATHRGRVLSRGQLIATVYSGDHHISERTIDTHVRNLRAKLAAAGAPVIETVHGVGYRCG